MIEEKTTQEIFEQSMKLSEPAYQENMFHGKDAKLKEYKDWLKRKWLPSKEVNDLLKKIKADCEEENTRYKKGWDDAINLLALELQKKEEN